MQTDKLFEKTEINGMTLNNRFVRSAMWEGMAGDHTKATCLSDNKCFGPAMAGQGIYCVVERGKDGGRS